MNLPLSYKTENEKKYLLVVFIKYMDYIKNVCAISNHLDFIRMHENQINH